jgi:H+/gluconate symporter-like permease
MLSGILIILIFLLMAAMMLARKLPVLLSLPLMAVLISLVSGVPAGDILKKVIADGSVRLSIAMVTVFFGAALGQFINNTGIAKSIIKKIAELSGDNPFWVSLMLSVVVGLLFTVLGGLGAVIMVATIVLPIMLSIGVPSTVAASIFLIGISLGGILNLANWQLYMSVLLLKQTDVFSFAIPFFCFMFLAAVVFLIIELRRGKLYLWAVKLPDDDTKVSFLSLLTPFIPLFLVLGFSIHNLFVSPATAFEFPIISAMICGLLWGVIFTWRGSEESMNILTKSIFEGISSSAPAVALIMGIGMLLNAVTHPVVSASIAPLVAAILPSSFAGYVIFFAALAPLSLYRGPLNIWGLGSGLIGIMLASGRLSAAAIMAAMLSVGQIQGVCDPTNTANVWIANYLNINVQDILKKTLLYMWALALVGLIIAGVKYF